MFSNNTEKTRTFDRLVGIFVTLGVVLSLGVAKNYVQKTYNARKEAARRKAAAKGDAAHKTRWRNTSGPQAVHQGACHCQRVRFRIKASKTIYAVDVPSKVRFPRISIPAASFEALSDDSAMSLYAVSTADGHGGMGVHTFCSYCGVHVVYAPSTDPSEIQVNVDCLDKSNVEDVMVSYMACADSTPVQLNYEPARPFNRRGTGSAGAHDAHNSSHGGGAGVTQAVLSNMYMLEGGSRESRYSSPAKGPRGVSHTPMDRGWAPVDPYASEGRDGQGSTSVRSIGDVDGDMEVQGGWLGMGLSPFSRKQAEKQQKQRMHDEACESYLDTYAVTMGSSSGHGAEAGAGGAAGLTGLGPYGGVNVATGQYDHPLYRYNKDEPEADAPQWNRYYSGTGTVGAGADPATAAHKLGGQSHPFARPHQQSHKESIDADIDLSGYTGLGLIGIGDSRGLSSMSPSPVKMRSFTDKQAAAAAYSFSPAGLSKQLDSMKAYLAHYPTPDDDSSGNSARRSALRHM